jgi:hypothetical protein
MEAFVPKTLNEEIVTVSNPGGEFCKECSNLKQYFCFAWGVEGQS